MLVLSRKCDESIIIDGRIQVRVLGIRGNQVRIGIDAPPEVKVVREELIGVPVGAVAGRAETDAPVATVLAGGSTYAGGPLSSALHRIHRDHGR